MWRWRGPYGCVWMWKFYFVLRSLTAVLSFNLARLAFFVSFSLKEKFVAMKLSGKAATTTKRSLFNMKWFHDIFFLVRLVRTVIRRRRRRSHSATLYSVKWISAASKYFFSESSLARINLVILLSNSKAKPKSREIKSACAALLTLKWDISHLIRKTISLCHWHSVFSHFLSFSDVAMAAEREKYFM